MLPIDRYARIVSEFFGDRLAVAKAGGVVSPLSLPFVPPVCQYDPRAPGIQGTRTTRRSSRDTRAIP